MSDLSKKAGWIGDDPWACGVVEQTLTASKHAATLLLEGETGTGKELLARIAHQNSPVSEGPFIAVNCGAIPSNLFESELFGHVAGAFTGASGERVGLLEAANGGTIFLDEIGEVPLALQMKLLRVLQESEVVRLGENTPRSIRVRIIAATNKNLKEAIEAKTFREDLFYRLSVVHLLLLPLRERPKDIPLLAEHFVKQASKRMGQFSRPITPEAMKILMAYDWPGNARELTNAIEHMMIYCEGPTLDESGLPESVLEGSKDPQHSEKMDLKRRVEMYEKRLIREAIRQSKGVKARAARLLGVKRTTLVLKMQRYGMALGKDDKLEKTSNGSGSQITEDSATDSQITSSS